MKDLIKKQKGFTIIEVLIVLAIAGLIILIVFLAVPALQRNSRTTQRNSDASAIAGSITECLSNKNGKQTSCSTVAANGVPVDSNKIKILKNEADNTMTNVSFCGAETTSCGAFTAATGTADVITDVNVRYGDKCVPAGDNSEAGTQRQFAVLYQVENSTGKGVTRCIDS